MTVLRRIAMLSGTVAVSALGLAAPASAIVPPADGYYVYNQPGKPSSKWTMQSLCTQANGTRAQQDYSDQTIQTLGCQVNVASAVSTAGMNREERSVSFNATAKLSNGLWTATSTLADGAPCPDGSEAPSTETYSFSEATLTGTHTSIHDAVCGLQPAMTKVPFTLTLTGPLDPPVVERFPMNCDYLAGRPSICS
ncbi:hypothetical protein BH11ACT7_BH11ACT7_40470 [soil metagenome]